VSIAVGVLRHIAGRDRLTRPAFEGAIAPHGTWAWDKLAKHARALMRQTTRAERTLIAQAVAHDTDFEAKFDDADFAFRYPGLPPRLQAASDPLLRAFYTHLTTGGVPVTRDGATAKVTRREIEEGYFAANPTLETCPACMEESLTLVATGPSDNDCDHFLPKSQYAPLAVHPGNLWFTCPRCNGRRKGEISPVANATEPGVLRTTYLPYRRAAEDELELTFTRETVKLQSTNGLDKVAQERVANLQRILGLETRWTFALGSAQREFIKAVGLGANEAMIEQELERAERLGDGPAVSLGKGCFLRGRYATYLREHHLTELADEWARTEQDHARSQALYSGT
jgi:hypothetical protein